MPSAKRYSCQVNQMLGGMVGVGGRVVTSRSTSRASLEELQSQTHDLLVIGGGITGAGIAREASMRGLKVALVDQGDLAGGTSSRSSRLVHGGLRYLEHGELRLVFEACRERRILLEIAPHLVHPLAFVFPVHRGDRVPLWKLAAGMVLYDLLAAFRNVRRHKLVGKRGLRELEPGLRDRGLVGGAVYYDAQCDDARLTLATARSAILHGAMVTNYCRVNELSEDRGRISGAVVSDGLTGAGGQVSARAVINATGPWTDGVRSLAGEAEAILRPTKGSHVVVPGDRIGNRHAITMTSPLDGRVMFIIPWGKWSYIGTTDTDPDEPPEAARATEEDMVYLLRSANAMFPGARLTEADVVSTWSGLRPLVAEPSGLDASAVSREHVVLESPNGMVTIAGGKLTTYRVMAQDAVDRAVRGMAEPPPSAGKKAATANERLPGGEASDLDPLRDPGRELGLPEATISHLLRAHGTETAAIYNLISKDRSLMEQVHAEHPAIAAQVVHGVRRELARTVADFLVRRTHVYYETADQGRAAAADVARLMGRELRWSSEECKRQTDDYLASADLMAD